MVPKNKMIANGEQTESLPSQEKVANGDQAALALSAEQVFAQLEDESLQDGFVQTQGFVP